MSTFRFVGKGAGVPGLPAVIGEDEAERRGLGDLLRAAIENGNYVADEGSVTDNTSDTAPRRHRRGVGDAGSKPARLKEIP